MDGAGIVRWWGFSPAFSLVSSNALHGTDCNVLLAGEADFRHVLASIEHLIRTAEEPGRLMNGDEGVLHFYLFESHLEVIARQLLLLRLLLEPPEKLGIQEKVSAFVELFGNSLIRQQTATYLREKSTELIKMVTDDDYLHQILPMVNLTSLKFRERDQLEHLFKFWRSEQPAFDMAAHWDNRVRQYLGVRYDSRKGVFDWDYHMKLQDKAPVVAKGEYEHWRETGVAFCSREADYDAPNRSLVSAVQFKQNGEIISTQSYWGDIVSSPFLSFGTTSRNKELLKKQNDRHVKTADDITQYNITEIVESLLKLFSSSRQGLAGQTTKSSQSSHAWQGFANWCQIHVMPLDALPMLHSREKFHQKFDVLYFSSSMVHHLLPTMASIMGDNARLFIETTKHVLDLAKEKHAEFIRKIITMADHTGCKLQGDCQPMEDNVASFLKL